MKVWPGYAYPLGAVFDGSGTNFCLFSQTAERVELCLFDEPWDLGEGGYQVGNFPPVWTEWNGKYRDCVRDFWRGEDQTMGEFSARITGSSDLYENTSRLPYASINFITAHDGFTLNDLVSYNEKHNETNGEENQDGESHNRSWNCGVEGPTDNPDVRELRNRQNVIFLPRCFFLRACLCCYGETKSAEPSRATIIPIARTTRSHGMIGQISIKNFLIFAECLFSIAKITMFFTVVAGFKDGPFMVVK